MNTDARVSEILSQITAFSEKSYAKAAFLPELMKLQQELVTLTFNGDHAENGNLRLWDVEKHLQKMNDERGNPADAELERFMQGSKVICNTIKAEVSGNAGEQRVFRALENLACQNGVLHNVELEFDGRRTEIDAIVFTNQAIFIIEIKNSKKDIFIDENGDFYRTGNSMHFDCNIADKMDEREALLRKALERSGVEFPKIFKIVTFTNPRIDVENKYHYIKVCGSNYLPVFIEKFRSERWYSYEDICTMMAAVSEAKCKEAYQMSIDMDTYKKDFATVMALLETAEDAPCAAEETSESHFNNENSNDTDACSNENHAEHQKQLRIAFGKGAVAAAVGITLVNAAFIGICKLVRK